MGGVIDILSGLFGSGAIGGSSAKTDRSNTLTSYSDLKNMYNWALPFAKSTAAQGGRDVSTGMGDLGSAGNYYKKLVSGDRPSMLQAVAPETKAVTDQADAAKRMLASSGTARGGGVSAANQVRDSDTMAKVDQLLFGVRPAAAEGAARVGTAEAGVGLGEQQAGIQAGALGEYAAKDLGELSSRNRAISNNIHRQAVNDISGAIESTIAGIMGLNFGGGGGGLSYMPGDTFNAPTGDLPMQPGVF